MMSQDRAAKTLARYNEQLLSQRERPNPVTLEEVRRAKEVLGISVGAVRVGRAPLTESPTS